MYTIIYEPYEMSEIPDEQCDPEKVADKVCLRYAIPHDFIGYSNDGNIYIEGIPDYYFLNNQDRLDEIFSRFGDMVRVEYDKDPEEKIKFDDKLYLTNEQRKNFLPGCCPKCGEFCVHTSDFEFTNEIVYKIHKCEQCGTSWCEFYEVVQVEKYPYEEE